MYPYYLTKALAIGDGYILSFGFPLNYAVNLLNVYILLAGRDFEIIQ
jgi:hypothetical protein